jgi:8-oxo-dGTP diphosphatase
VLTGLVCQSDINKVLKRSLDLPKIPTFVPVVAIALIAPDRRILMQQRRADRAHGGLWEFPGGKVEAGESPESALIREIAEELGIVIDHLALEPLTFASDPAQPPAPRQPHVILLYTCRIWSGEPRCLDGDCIAWIAPEDLMALPMPPLDVPLAKALLKAI